jgi:hypothetical protein
VLQRFGFVAGIPPAPPTAPRLNLTDDPYFTDGLRLFLQLNGRGTTSPEDVEFLEWQKSPDPLGEAWRDAPVNGG